MAKIMNRRAFGFGVILACMLAVASQARAEEVVRLGNLKFVHYGAVFYMKELAPKYGIRIEEQVFAKGIDIYPAVAEGKIDIAASAVDGAIAARGNGVPLYVVAGFSNGGARILVRKGSPIKAVADLRGKTVATARGGAHELLLLASLEKAGLTWWSGEAATDVKIKMMAYADLNKALADGEVDAICQSEPQSAVAIAQGIADELHRPYDTQVGLPVRALVMTEKMYKERPALAEKVIRLLVEATVTFQTDGELAERYVRETVFGGKLTTQDYKGAMENAAFTTGISREHVQNTTDMMARYGLGKMAEAPYAPDWVKLDLLLKATLPQATKR